MAHFAELDENNIVLRVVVVDDAHEADGENWCKEFFGTDKWKQTSYTAEFRKNFAGVGFNYNPTLDAFIPPCPPCNPSWTLDEDSCLWEAEIPSPGTDYIWDDSAKSWGLWNSV